MQSSPFHNGTPGQPLPAAAAAGGQSAGGSPPSLPSAQQPAMQSPMAQQPMPAMQAMNPMMAGMYNPLFMQQMAAAQMQMAMQQQQGGLAMNPMMLQMLQMQQMMIQQQQQQQQHAMGRGAPAGQSAGSMLPFNPMLPMPMFNPMMAPPQQQHAMAGPGTLFNPAMHAMPPVPSPSQPRSSSQPATGFLSPLPPLPPTLPAQLSPAASETAAAVSSPAGPDVFAALDAESEPSSLPDLPGAPLRMKAKQSTTNTPPSSRGTAATGADASSEAESDFGEFEAARAAPASLQPQPQQHTLAPHTAGPHSSAPFLVSTQLPPQFSMQGQPMQSMMQQPQQMSAQQLHFMQQQRLFLQQQQQQQYLHQQQQQQPRPVVERSDDFGGFTSATSAPPVAHQAPQPTAVPAVREISFDPPAAASDDFGTFESAQPKDSQPTSTADEDDFEADFQHAAAPSTVASDAFSSPAQLASSSSSGSSSSTTEAAVPAPVPSSMEALLHSALGKAFDSHKANAPLVDAPAAATLHSMQLQPQHAAGNSATASSAVHKGRELPSELDDLLNSLLPDAVSHDAPLPTLPFDDRRAALQAEQDELDFDDFSSANNGTKPANHGDTALPAPSAVGASHTAEEEDDFADFSSAPSDVSALGPAAGALPSEVSSSGAGSGGSTNGTTRKEAETSGSGKRADASAPVEEAQIAAAIAAAAKKKGGSFAFSSPSATQMTAIAPPTVAPLSFGPPPPVSLVSLSALAPPPAAAPSPIPALFDLPAVLTATASSAADEDDFDANFDQPAAATPFGVGLPSLMGAGGGSQQSYFDDEEESDDSSSAAQSSEQRQSNLQAPLDSPVELPTSSASASELSGARKSSVSTLSTRSTPATAFDLLHDFTPSSNGTAPSSSPLPLAPLSAGDMNATADQDDFAGFTSADNTMAPSSSLASSAALSVAIPVSPTAIPPPSPLPSLPSSTSLAALSALFAFPALPSPLPLSLSSSHSPEAASSPSSALSLLLAQDRFAEWQLLSAHLKATQELPSLQSAYKEAIAASMDDEEQLPVAMALQARIKKVKAIQPNEQWMRPLSLDEQLKGDGSVPSLSYTQLVTLLSAVNISALPAFSSSFPQPFAAALQQSTGGEPSSGGQVEAAAQLQHRANKQLRSAVGLLPCHHAVFASRAARVWSHIAEQLQAGLAFVQQVATLEAGGRKDSRLTAALATASSFLSSLSALYRVHLRLCLAQHTYHLTACESAAAVEQSWAAIKRAMTKGPWKSAVDGKHKQLAGVLAAMEVDSLQEWQPLLLTGQTLVDTCELCLGRLDGKMSEKSMQLAVTGGGGVTGGCTISLHQLCGNLWKAAGLLAVTAK